MIVAGGIADRINAWGLTGSPKPHYDSQNTLNSGVRVEICAALPLLLGRIPTSDFRSSGQLSCHLAVFASADVLRRLGVYNGALVQVGFPSGSVHLPTLRLLNVCLWL